MLEAARLSEAGNAHLTAGRVEDAIAAQLQAAKLWPQSGAIQCNLGNALQAARRTDAAAAAFLRAAELQPEIPESHNNLGAIWVEQGNAAEALASLDRALKLRPAYGDAWYNRGNALVALARDEEAEAAYRRALQALPKHVGARRNLAAQMNRRGNALVAANRPGEALPAYREALAAEPENPDLEYNEALAQLVRGDLAEGWDGYERRFECQGKKGPRSFGFPRWDGKQSLSGKSIFVFAEQGLGDTLQFARYLPMLAERGARVELEAQPALHSLLRASFPELASLSGKGDPVPVADFHLPLLSLPAAFGTTLETVPAPMSYLQAPPDGLDRWQGRLGPDGALRVGLVWSGAAGHQNDHNRSISLGKLAEALFEVPGAGVSAPGYRSHVRWFCVQKDVREADQAELAARSEIRWLGPELGDFGDTAAAIAQMDLVISVDTSVAHLSAALGKSTWILLPFSPDWRWLLEREDSPWYPTVRLFRQPAPGDWASALGRVRVALGEWKRRPAASSA
ncbi:MAG TPA: tetratricopeptide repeat-containing glycosyltransferase family protein [Opitutaceae bacterium]|jgi:tetratricopeptide (TPR) repeat protein